MIGYLRGQVLESSDGRVLLGVGSAESGFVGYSVMVPNSASYLGFVEGARVEIHVYTHVREDALDLYGFASAGEKELFLALLTVNGIGPKGAMGMLSKVSPSELVSAVLAGDKDALTRVPGIGKKTAERVVLELADPLRKRMESGALSGSVSKKAHSKSGTALHATPAVASGLRQFVEAKEALVGLGYREQEVASLLNQLTQEEGRPARVEDLIRTALRRLASP